MVRGRHPAQLQNPVAFAIRRVNRRKIRRRHQVHGPERAFATSLVALGRHQQGCVPRGVFRRRCGNAANLAVRVLATQFPGPRQGCQLTQRNNPVRGTVRFVGGGELGRRKDVHRPVMVLVPRKGHAHKQLVAVIAIQVARQSGAFARTGVPLRADDLPGIFAGGDISEMDHAIGLAIGCIRRGQTRRRNDVNGAGIPQSAGAVV